MPRDALRKLVHMRVVFEYLPDDIETLERLVIEREAPSTRAITSLLRVYAVFGEYRCLHSRYQQG